MQPAPQPEPARATAPPRADPREAALSPRDFARLSAFIERHFGIRMPPEKRTLLEGRLARRVRAFGSGGFSRYCDEVLGGAAPDELVQMVDAVTTNKTDFFREPEHFEVLRRDVLPALAARHGAGTRRPLRLWSAGCSTGEEPYTLAMLLSEWGVPFDVLATDLSTRVLRQAHAALYRDALTRPIPLPLRRRHLLRSAADRTVVRVRRALRERVRFTRLNLLDDDYAVSPAVDVIFCRNVFIYFERATQRQVLLRFARHLVPGGHLFLGHSETINGLDVPFDAVAPTVYRLRG